ncbi:hypothetical protein [Nevskia sp.]|uniref:hypothetical protein n=1 Tax=Nevskia sp. TaxID=1929292 RepID=UPI0025F30C04|nr:hypothetical protein [Nevskia sp.]
MTSVLVTPKQQAQALIAGLPEDASWQELAYRLEVRADIEQGLADVAAGRTTSIADLRREFGLSD